MLPLRSKQRCSINSDRLSFEDTLADAVEKTAKGHSSALRMVSLLWRSGRIPNVARCGGGTRQLLFQECLNANKSGRLSVSIYRIQRRLHLNAMQTASNGVAEVSEATIEARAVLQDFFGPSWYPLGQGNAITLHGWRSESDHETEIDIIATPSMADVDQEGTTPPKGKRD